MKYFFTAILMALLLPCSLFSNTNERNRHSAEKTAIKYLDQMVNGKWAGLEQHFLKKYAYAKSMAEFESRLSKTDDNVLFKKSTARSAGNRSIENGILNDGSLVKTEIWQEWWNSNWDDRDKYQYTYDQSDHLADLIYSDWHEGIWNAHWIERYTYSGDNLVQELWQDYNANTEAWVNTDQWTNEYDEAGNRISTVYQGWSANQWQNAWRDSFKYNDDGNEVEFLSQQWGESDWINSFRVSTAFNQNGSRAEVMGQTWDADLGWVNLFKSTLSYDESGRLVEIRDQNYNGQQFVNSVRFVITYEGNTTLTWLFQEYNGNSYVDLMKTILVYNGEQKDENLTEQSDYYWDTDNSIWMNGWRVTHIYDQNGNLIEIVSQEGNGNSWLNYYKTVQSFNEHTHISSVIEQYWEGGNWMNGWRGNFEYVTATGISDNMATVNQWRLEDNYPNPFNPSTTISYQLAKDTEIDLSVYNLLGQKLVTLVAQKQPAGTYNVKWNAAGLSSGVYIYKLQAGSDFIQSKKLVLLK